MPETQQIIFKLRLLNPEPGGNVSKTEITYGCYPNTCGPLEQKVGTYSTILPDKARTYFQTIAKEKAEFRPGETRVEVTLQNGTLEAESNPIVVYLGAPALGPKTFPERNHLGKGSGFRMHGRGIGE
jgi:hypothetical protein